MDKRVIFILSFICLSGYACKEDAEDDKKEVPVPFVYTTSGEYVQVPYGLNKQIIFT